MSKRDWSRWIARAPPVGTSGGGRVLLISYLFPPTGGSGVHRPAKLAKYLPPLGWSVEVLTAAHARFEWLDGSLEADIPAECRVHRVAGYEPACVAESISSLLTGKNTGTESRCRATDAGRDSRGHTVRGRGRHGGRPFPRRWLEDRLYWRLARVTDWLGMGNGESLWIGRASPAAVRRHGRQPFDVLLSTGPPQFAHRAAMRIARATGLPWVADVRDPLVSDFDRTPPSTRQAQRMRRLERAIMQEASIVVTTCPSLAADLRSRYPRRRPESVCAITNGFDRDDLGRVAGMSSRGPGDQESAGGGDASKECVFVAAGSFYGRREIVRMVQPLRRVLDEHPQWRGHVRLEIVGTIDGEQRGQWEGNGPAWLRLSGYVDHGSAIRAAAGAACTIVVVPNCEHGRLSIPGKTFELLALPTHLLALVPPGSDTERIVAEAGGCTVVALEDGPGIAAAMVQIIDDHLAGRLAARRDWPLLDAYDRRVTARHFAECLQAACAASGARVERNARRQAWNSGRRRAGTTGISTAAAGAAEAVEVA